MKTKRIHIQDLVNWVKYSDSYSKRKQGVMFLISLATSAIAYIGCPPPQIQPKETPIPLEKLENTGYDSSKFARIDIYSGRQRLCSIISTTAVRNYFDDQPGQFVERTRINRELCKVPVSTSTLDAVVSAPYEPEPASFSHSMDSCIPFRAGSNQTRCKVDLRSSQRNIYLVMYDNTQAKNATSHERNADRIDIQIVK